MTEFYHQKHCDGTSATPNFTAECRCVPTATMPLRLSPAAYKAVRQMRDKKVLGINGRFPTKAVIAELENYGLRMQIEHPLHEAKMCYPLHPVDFKSRTEHIAEIGDKPTRTPRGNRQAMVLVYQPELTHSVWQDLVIRTKWIELLEKRLREGTRKGEWVAWRIITIEKEAMGNASSAES